VIEGDKLKVLSRIGLMLATCDRRRSTKGSKQNRPKDKIATSDRRR
jgi:hypothetical protein